MFFKVMPDVIEVLSSLPVAFIHLTAALRDNREHKCPEERLGGQSRPGMVGGCSLKKFNFYTLKGKLWVIKNSKKGGGVS